MINIQAKYLTYNEATGTYYGSERHISFATTYGVEDEGALREFKFSHSTGPEFNPTTQWVYTCGLRKLIIANDELITKINKQNYLDAKLKR